MLNGGRPFTPETLAERWEVDPGTVRRMCRTGRIRSFKVGVAHRITPDAVEAFEAGEAPAMVDRSSSGGVPSLREVKPLASPRRRKQEPA